MGGGAAPAAKGTGVGLALVEDAHGHSVLRMRGLPFTAVKADIITFFEGFGLEDHHIFFVNDASGRPSGEAFAVFGSEEGAKTALRDKDKKEVQGRWIDLFPTTRVELYNRVGIGAGIKREDFNDKVCVKMRGLPWSASVQQVSGFFEGLRVAPHGVFILNGMDQRPTGDAYVVFESVADATEATNRHKSMMGEREVDVIQCCKGDLYVTTTYCPVVSGHQTGQITYSRGE